MRINSERNEITDLDDAMALVYAKILLEQESLESKDTGDYTYLDGLRKGKVEGMYSVLTMLNMLIKGRSI